MQMDMNAAMLHSDKDIIVLSPTGSGKTLAYLLPLVQLLDAGKDCLQAVVLVPGRELALQSATVLKDMGCGLRAMALYGGRPAMEEHRKMREVRPQVVFATPGRMNDHLVKGNLGAFAVKWLIIDEFDKCLALGFREEMNSVIKQLRRVERRVLLSATDAEEIPMFVNMRRTIKASYLAEGNVAERIALYQVKSPQKDKLETLDRLLRYAGSKSSVVFLNYRDSVERTANYLREKGFSVSLFHGGLEQKKREDALYKFSNGSANILVCTDLASRGLDIPDIDNIVHYHLPESEDGYVHRVGRTARWDKSGKACFVLGPEERMPDYVEQEAELLELPSELPPPAEPKMATVYIGKGKKDKISKGDIVGFLCKIGGLANGEIGRIDVKDRFCYAAINREKLSQVLEKTKGEKIKGVKTLIEVVK